jgi:hypothetical protein
MNESNFKVGDVVRFQRILQKNPETMHYDETDSLGSGVLVGFRTVHDMRLDYEDGYYIGGSHRIALVAFNLYRSPIKVPINHLFEENPR